MPTRICLACDYHNIHERPPFLYPEQQPKPTRNVGLSKREEDELRTKPERAATFFNTIAPQRDFNSALAVKHSTNLMSQRRPQYNYFCFPPPSPA